MSPNTRIGKITNHLKKRYTYDKIVTQRKDWSEDMIELEENQKELQTLSDKLKEIGESL